MNNATYLQREAQMDRFGLKVAAHLDDLPLPHDISERLRVARQQALAQRKTASATQTQAAASVSASGSAAVLGGGEGFSWFNRFASAVPVLALAIGLVAIHINVNDDRANELAEVDTQLLTDDLPPSAHTDPGFAQYLKFGPPAGGQ
ncbi:DUF3619 family protein [Variovorax sp. PCZ-1]|uniref:DUF3619 family protein n=1 Tax=Variovorax sp. PCZ-1 TaxID=2835533 RepID=UPI001BCF2016|nr:DUF3619 family protein [Variovorax sp. PCZ-1]MBS7807598.1 DUF3619 family protein [Variovorax sp. PCZ-1]